MFSMNDFDQLKFRQQELLQEAQRQRFALNLLRERKSLRDTTRRDESRRGDLRQALARVAALFF